MKKDYYMLWLKELTGLKLSFIKILLDHFKTAENIFNASKKQLKEVKGFGDASISKLLNSKDLDKLEAIIKKIESNNIEYISIENDKYPYLLKIIEDPPLALYVKGNMINDDIDKIAVIGSRRCSEYGEIAATKISKSLSDNNIVVVSGMARGIDSFAHMGALKGNGNTIAVLGSGIDVCYPPENENLMNKIIERGCVISEYPLGTPPYPANFPKRNRIISGLCKAVIVVEASLKSGSIITVENALHEGRDVFAVPGNITSILSEGTNKLIKEGAGVVSNINDIKDILYEMGIEYTAVEKKEYIDKFTSKENNGDYLLLDEKEKEVYSLMSLEPIPEYEIEEKTKIDVKDLSYILTILEIKGFITKLPGDRYIKSL